MHPLSLSNYLYISFILQVCVFVSSHLNPLSNNNLLPYPMPACSIHLMFIRGIGWLGVHRREIYRLYIESNWMKWVAGRNAGEVKTMINYCWYVKCKLWCQLKYQKWCVIEGTKIEAHEKMHDIKLFIVIQKLPLAAVSMLILKFKLSKKKYSCIVELTLCLMCAFFYYSQVHKSCRMPTENLLFITNRPSFGF